MVVDYKFLIFAELPHPLTNNAAFCIQAFIKIVVLMCSYCNKVLYKEKKFHIYHAIENYETRYIDIIKSEINYFDEN